MLLVDPLREYREAPYGIRWWCHLHSDQSLDELHAFATSLGMARSWFQRSPYAHYDLTAKRRAHALSLGAVEIGAKTALRRNFDFRRHHGLP